MPPYCRRRDQARDADRIQKYCSSLILSPIVAGLAIALFVLNTAVLGGLITGIVCLSDTLMGLWVRTQHHIILYLCCCCHHCRRSACCCAPSAGMSMPLNNARQHVQVVFWDEYIKDFRRVRHRPAAADFDLDDALDFENGEGEQIGLTAMPAPLSTQTSSFTYGNTKAPGAGNGGSGCSRGPQSRQCAEGQVQHGELGTAG